MSNSAARQCCCNQGSCDYVWLLQLCGHPECVIIVCEGSLPASPEPGKVALASPSNLCFVLISRWAIADMPVWYGGTYGGSFAGSWYACDHASCCEDVTCSHDHCGNVDVYTAVCCSPATTVLAKRAFQWSQGEWSVEWNDYSGYDGSVEMNWSLFSRVVTTGGGSQRTVVAGTVTLTATDFHNITLASGDGYDGTATHAIGPKTGTEHEGVVTLSSYCPSGINPQTGEFSVCEAVTEPVCSNAIDVVDDVPVCVTGGTGGTVTRVWFFSYADLGSSEPWGSVGCNETQSGDTRSGGTGYVYSATSEQAGYGNGSWTRSWEVYDGGVLKASISRVTRRSTLIDWCDGVQNGGGCLESMEALMLKRPSGLVVPRKASVTRATRMPADPRLEGMTQEANTPRGCCGRD